MFNAGGVPTRHTHTMDGLHTRHLLESTHANTTQTQHGPTKYGESSRRGAQERSVADQAQLPKGRAVLPRATNHQLVGIGQGESVRLNM